MDAWFESIRKGDCAYVRSKMSEFARSVNAQGLSGLMLAAQLGHEDVAVLLCDAEHNMQDQQGDYASYYALRSGNIGILDYLLPFESNEQILREISLSAANTKILRQQSRYGAYRQSIYKLYLMLDERAKMQQAVQKPPEQRHSTPDDVVKKLIYERDRLNLKITELQRIITQHCTTIDEEQSTCKRLYGERVGLLAYIDELKSEVARHQKVILVNVQQISSLEQQNQKLQESITILKASQQQPAYMCNKATSMALAQETYEPSRLSDERLYYNAVMTEQAIVQIQDLTFKCTMYYQLLHYQLEAQAKENSALAKLCNTQRENVSIVQDEAHGDYALLHATSTNLGNSLLTVGVCILTTVAIGIMGYLSYQY